MTVISRLEGSPLTTTSASTIVTHLTTIVLPRVAPYFNRLRAQTASRNADRLLRAEQDRAYDEAGRKDTERVLKKRAEEEIKRKAAELAARDMEEERIKEERVRQLVERGIRWRRWKRKTMAVEPDVAEEGTARISVRLGDGRVAVRRFRVTQTIEDLYDFVECSLDPREAEEEVENSTISVQKPLRYEHIFEFQLATTFPRVLLSSSSRETIQDAGGMIPSANLIVEGLAARRISMGESNPDDDEEEEEVEEED
jgi:FAS-associated factor 2